jgi:hypothetical protein
VFFNYACLNRKRAAQLLTIVQLDPKESWEGRLFFIDGSLKKTKLVDSEENLYARVPQTPARQKITTEQETQLCIDGARISEKEPIFYYFNEKTHSTSLHLLKYFTSLEEVSSLLYFCQFLLPDEGVVKQFQLT